MLVVSHLLVHKSRCVLGICREKAKGATFFEATEGETVRPMLDVSWAPMLGAFSVLFEEFSAGDSSSASNGTDCTQHSFIHQFSIVTNLKTMVVW